MNFWVTPQSGNINNTWHGIFGGNWQTDTNTTMRDVICQKRIGPFVNNSLTTNGSYYYTASTGWVNDTTSGISYYSMNQYLSWSDAEAYCRNMGAILPIFHNQTELDAFTRITQQYYLTCGMRYWLGYIQNLDMSFCSLSNEVPTYFNWKYGIANGSLPCDACVYSYGWGSNTTWNTVTCSLLLNFICQVRPDKTSSPSASTCPCNGTSTTTSSTKSTLHTTVNPLSSTTPPVTHTSLETISTPRNTNTPLVTTTTPTISVFTTDPLLPWLDIKNPTPDGGKVAQASNVHASIPFIVQTLNDSIKQDMGYSLQQLLISCTYNGVPCDLKNDFQWLYNPTLGNCYTYNSGQNPKSWVYRAGANYGLRMVLTGSQSESTCSSINAGFKIVIHENNLQPFPEADGYYVPYGVVSSFTVSQHSVSKLSQPYGNCAEPDFETFIQNYSVEACERLCFQQYMIKSCNCADPRYLLPEHATYCGPEKSACLENRIRCEWSIVSNCSCPPPCNEIIYQTVSTTAKLLNENILKASFCTEYSPAYVCNEDFTILYMYYDNLKTYVFAETPSYGVLQLMSDFSGVTGLLLGICVMTVLEVFMFIINICEVCVKFFDHRMH